MNDRPDFNPACSSPTGSNPAGSNPAWEALDLPGAEVAWLPCWLDAGEANTLFGELHRVIGWERHRIRLFGRAVDVPRLSCWIGDPVASYTYSGTRFEPRPWSPLLAALRDRVAHACGARFNSALANLYRDGADSMGWHSDDEPELGPQPVIASLSLGAERRFRMRRKLPRGSRPGAGDTLALRLGHGSLLRMAGDTQRLYRHDLPKVRAPTGPRINLTFRWIVQPPASAPLGLRRGRGDN